MNIVDVLIIIFLVFGALIGFKRGFTKQLLSFLGTVLAVVLAFIFKNPISILLYENLPFFKFGGIFKGITVLNILIYEVLAFFIILAVIMIVLRILLFASGVFEKLLNMTIILGIPSKILGAVMGILENFIITFIVLYILSLPVFKFDILNKSKLRDDILKKTPILSGYVDNSIKVIDEFVELKDKYQKSTDPNAFNLESLNLLLKYKVVSIESVDKLIEKDKLQIKNIGTVLENYR